MPTNPNDIHFHHNADDAGLHVYRTRSAAVVAVMIVVLALVLAAGSSWFNSYSNDKVSDERASQLSEIVEQVGTNFQNALDFNWDFLDAGVSVCNETGTLSKKEASRLVAQLDRRLGGSSENDTGDVFYILLDSRGRSYDANGRNGVWADFEQVGTSEQATFIADSRSYSGTYWAFVQKLAEPITVTGEGSITHIALLRSASGISQYFASDAYQEVAETYVLNANGTRMYDNSSQTDTIEAFNVVKALRDAEEQSGHSFDAVEAELEETGIATSEVTINDTEYCYSLYEVASYGAVLMFLVPSSAVAANTVEMVQSIINILVLACLIIVIAVGVCILVYSRMQNNMRLAEEERENLAEQERINERLKQANASLSSARKSAESALVIAESANKAKSNFLSNMSHDIRTPLNAIIGFEQLLERDAASEDKVREYAAKIKTSGQHLLRLINDILDMSRIESGKTVLNTEPFTIASLVAELEDIIGPQAAHKQQSFTVEVELPEGFTIIGDKLRMNQILMNLLSNAVKYTPEGGAIALRVERLSTRATGMALLRFTVEDNGIGMSEEFQQRLFDPFEREYNSTTSGVEGTGLGMAIDKSLVNLMGGRITVDSELGVGSTFVVELSLRLACDDGICPVDFGDGEAEGEAYADALAGKHFLVAEDNAINAEITAELLRAEGASCDIVENGQLAVEAFEASQPGDYDAILMDVQMPVMNGHEATRAIRACAHLRAKSIPIAAMTANAFVEDEQQALACGMNAHIAKPVDMKKVREFIATYAG